MSKTSMNLIGQFQEGRSPQYPGTPPSPQAAFIGHPQSEAKALSQTIQGGQQVGEGA